MSAPMTKEQAAAAAAAAASKRDNIQANLLDLDASFGKRLLAGAKLTGRTQQQWAAATADLTDLWETFNAYSAVVDRAAELAADIGRGSAVKVAEIARLLTGPSVRLASAAAPLGQRELTASASTDITVTAAVSAMEHAYASAAAVCGEAEAVWNQIADGLQEAGAGLDQAERKSAGLADADLISGIAVARANLGQLRQTLNTDPLVLGPPADPGNPGLAALASLRQQVSAMSARADELDRLRADGVRRITAVAKAMATATVAWQDAVAAQQRAAARIADAAVQPLEDPGEMASRVAGLAELQAAARWVQLGAELASLEHDVAAAQRRYRDAQAEAMAGLERRDEMRGLLDAYKAKAAALGSAEDARLTALYEQARDMLWTAPCDIAAASSAVTSYQRAVLQLAAAGGRS
jgi:hypothetical protein